MTRAAAAAALALVLALAALACGGSDPETPPAAPTRAPATEPAATATATATETPATATATETPATATEAPATEPAPTASATPAEPEEPREPGDPDLEIVTLLPPDAIPAIDNPRFVTAEEADRQLTLSDLVIGVSIDGEHRAYGAAFLSAHEIVNDTLGGRAIAVTW